VTGRVVTLQLAEDGAAPMRAVRAVDAERGRGLIGDRYWAGRGRFSRAGDPTYAVTLVERETLEALWRDHRLALDGPGTRRNVVTEGIALNHLVGRSFRIGAALLRGHALCEPCFELERRTRPGVLGALVHRGGLRAEVLESGLIAVGDPIVPGPPG
jgi:MOSC domain-containing protein YiiM